jgi:hypothetical protein
MPHAYTCIPTSQVLEIQNKSRLNRHLKDRKYQKTGNRQHLHAVPKGESKKVGIWGEGREAEDSMERAGMIGCIWSDR